MNLPCSAQQHHKQNPVYIDSKGIMRWTATNKEAEFFGVNYTIPFAYGYRSHKSLGVDIEKAIDACSRTKNETLRKNALDALLPEADENKEYSLYIKTLLKLHGITA